MNMENIKEKIKQSKSWSKEEKRFKYLHNLPSDAGFIAYGKNLEELFKNCALALFSIICDVEKIQPKKEIKISISSKKVDEMLYAFLSQILAESEIYELFFSKVTVKIAYDKSKKEYLLESKVFGEEQSEEKGRNLVKAITLHDFSVRKQDNKYIAKVYVDL